MAIDTAVVVGSVSISGNDFPIFGTRDRATEYLLGTLNAGPYNALSFTDKGKALVMGHRLLSRQKWKTGFPVPTSGLVPLGIEFAQYELAILLAEDSDVFNNANTGSNEKRLRAGPVEIEFFSRTDGGGSAFGSSAIFPPQVIGLISEYLSTGLTVVTPTVSGLTNKSSVIGVDQFGLNEPL